MLENTIHYVWIGPPTKDDITAIAGHDVAGPVEMARQLRQQANGKPRNLIKFWCLKEHVERYKTQFRELGVEEDIQVCAVEDLLKKEEKNSLLSKDVALLQTKLEAIVKNTSLSEVVGFKDHFSFFLLASQPGHFLDTNVFPRKNATLLLAGDVKAWIGRSHTGVTEGDYYLMYSPRVHCKAMLGALDSYRSQYQQAGCFAEFDKILSYKEMKAMGIKKISYNSWQSSLTRVRGLFYWMDREFSLFQKMLDYGDINLQVTYPNSVVILEEIDFYRAPDNEDFSVEEKLLALPFPNQKAYVDCKVDEKEKCYYVDRALGSVVLVPGHKGFHYSFQNSAHTQGLEDTCRPGEVQKFVSDMVKKANNIQNPPILYPLCYVNIGGCTLLHQAVVMGRLDLVELLISKGVNLNLRACYQALPSKKIMYLTPLELAQDLKLAEISEVLLEERRTHDNDSMFRFFCCCCSRKKINSYAPLI